ncbi:biotin transporter BioY [Selenomonas sp. TAMA-11512]|uniref:biotin transporter BioY n=1 Tax=Selenomonas sp. TAMA-11512 TaxID=3095337 RepID=UPI003088D37A|nr:biotin transporter BioY [Selenomonas sp. TAMA-11512]
MNQEFNTRTLTKMALLVALCCVSAYIAFPLPFTPGMVSAITLAMDLAAFLLTPKQTFFTMLTYTLLGAVGLPVFTGGFGGMAKILGPTGGFIFAFMVAYPAISYFKGKEPNFKRYALAAIFVGIPITYVGGVAGIMIVMDLNLWEGLVMSAFPFIPGDIMKALAAAYLGVKLNRALER